MKPVQVYDGDGRKRQYSALPRELHAYLVNSHVEVWEADFVSIADRGGREEAVSITNPGPNTMKKIDKLIDILQRLREHDVDQGPIFKQMTFLAQGQNNYMNRQILSLDYQIDYGEDVDDSNEPTGGITKTTTVKLVWYVL